MTYIITYDELREQVGGSTPAEVAARARREGIPVLTGKRGRPFTTQRGLDHALGLDKPQPAEQRAEIEVL